MVTTSSQKFSTVTAKSDVIHRVAVQESQEVHIDDSMQEVPVENSSTITIDSTDSTVTTVEEVTTNEVTKIVIPKKVDTNISKQIKLRPPTLKDNPKIKKTSDRKQAQKLCIAA